MAHFSKEKRKWTRFSLVLVVHRSALAWAESYQTRTTAVLGLAVDPAFIQKKHGVVARPFVATEKNVGDQMPVLVKHCRR